MWRCVWCSSYVIYFLFYLGTDMNDKELLELAAKAAGWIVIGETNKMVCSENDLTKCGLCIRTGAELDSFWNPLTDDGDALRLAVKLKTTVTVDDDAYTVVEAALFEKAIFVDAVERHEKSDQYAATRRAIVRAAAEIGKTL